MMNGGHWDLQRRLMALLSAWFGPKMVLVLKRNFLAKRRSQNGLGRNFLAKRAGSIGIK